MKRALTVAGLLVSALLLTSVAAFAQPPRGLSIDASALLKHPDLAVEKIMFTDVDYGDVVCTFEVRVLVRNTGTSGAPACNVMVNYCNNALGSTPMMSWTKRMTHALNPKGSSVITFELILPHTAGTPWKGMLVAIADPPVAGKPTGEIREWPALMAAQGTTPPRSETNNVFGVIFDAGSNVVPIHWDNPAVD